MTLREMIQGVQAAVGVQPDGIAGPQTWGVLYRRLALGEKKATATPADISTVLDGRSERLIETLLPEVRPYARSLVHECAERDLPIVITSGTRTYAEQDALYAQGRTTPGTRVTAARGGYSNHNFGLAFDVTLFEGKKPVFEAPAYKAIGAIGRGLGLTWGGDWHTFTDEPHFELRPPWAAKFGNKELLAELRRRKAAGTPVFA